MGAAAYPYPEGRRALMTHGRQTDGGVPNGRVVFLGRDGDFGEPGIVVRVGCPIDRESWVPRFVRSFKKGKRGERVARRVGTPKCARRTAVFAPRSGVSAGGGTRRRLDRVQLEIAVFQGNQTGLVPPLVAQIENQEARYHQITGEKIEPREHRSLKHADIGAEQDHEE